MEKKDSSSNEEKYNGSNAEIIIALVCIIVLSVWVWFGIDDGIVGGRRGREYSLEGDPLMYLFIVGMRLFCCSLGIWFLFNSLKKHLSKNGKT